jgi:hypothetical protein
MKLTVADRFRLFFYGAVKEMAAFNRLAQEHRVFRDAFAGVTDLVLCAEPKPGRAYAMVEVGPLLRLFERVYGTDHPHTVRLRQIDEQTGAAMQAGQIARSRAVN